MGMEQLIATLERETNERCAAALEEARREAERIRREADQHLQRRRVDAVRAMEAERRAWENEELASTRNETRAAILRARRRALDRVFDRADALLPTSMDDRVYLDSLTEELQRALSFLADEEVELECPSELAARLEAAARAGPAEATAGDRSIRVKASGDVAAGFIARGTSSGVRVDVTLGTRLEDLRSELEPEVLRRLEALKGADR